VFPRDVDSAALCVWVFDCAAGVVLDSIPVSGETPTAAYHSGSGKLYFAVKGPTNVYLEALDAVTDSIVLDRQMGVATASVQLLAGSAGNRVYLVDNNANEFYAIDVTTDSIVRTTVLPRDVDTMYENLNHGTLYLCREGTASSGRFFVYDCALDSIVKTETTGYRYIAALNPATDHLFLGSSSGISVFNCATNELLTTLGGITGPRYTALDSAEDRLYFAKNASFLVAYQDVAAGVEEGQNAASFALSVSGNPCRGRAEIGCEVLPGQKAMLSIHDIAGRTVGRYELVGRAGTLTVTWPEAGVRMPSGVYFARLVSGAKRQTVKVVLE
jgi:DNA-binding beta-propeller fold protein YncE